MKRVFEFIAYKDVMAAYLTGVGHRGQMTKAAAALNCQRSYLSRVITENLHLTPEHAFNLAEFLNFTELEREYFIALVERDRAAGPRYSEHWKRKITELKRRNESVQERANRQSVSLDSSKTVYFTSWTWTAIHFLTAVNNGQTARAIAGRLNLADDFVRAQLKQMSEQGLVENSGEKWHYKSGEFHAGSDSPLVLLHHQNWRARAVQDAQVAPGANTHFTGIMTLSREDAARIKELMLEFIAKANQITGPSNPEECIAVLCDLFPV